MKIYEAQVKYILTRFNGSPGTSFQKCQLGILNFTVHVPLWKYICQLIGIIYLDLFKIDMCFDMDSFFSHQLLK